MSLRTFTQLIHIGDITPINISENTSAQNIANSAQQHTDYICSANDCLSKLVILLDEQPYAIYTQDDHTHIIDRSCLDCVTFRSWLFALITSVETSMKKDMLSNAYWREAMSPERIQKARDLKEERSRRGQEVDTMSCMQFGDLGHASFK